MRVVTCAGGAPWEAPLVRGLQRRELGVEVLRRCVDHGELLGVALRDRPRAAVVAAELPWLDRELVGSLHDAGVTVVAVESTPGLRPLDRIGVAYRLAAPSNAEEVAALLHQLGGDNAESLAVPSADHGVVGSGADSNESRSGTGPAASLVAVWGGAGAPGRTSVSVHLAAAAARTGRTTLLVDGDAWSASVAQLLGLPDSPAVTNAARLAAEGWPEPLESCLHRSADGFAVLAGLPRADLWPEVRERAWRAVLDAARDCFELVIVDLAAAIDEDEELAFDRAPYRRNLMTRLALAEADRVVMVVAADPIGIRRAIFAHHQLHESMPAAVERAGVVLNRVPTGARHVQECSAAVERWTGAPPLSLLPVEPAFTRVVWEGRTLFEVAPRARWLRELGPLAREVLR
jgi:Mrp family chromosome partitioning ATPase